MTLNASNNVGIGTTNPLNKLFVSASTAGDYAGFIENTNSTNGYGLVARTAHTGTSAYAFAARAASTDIFVVRGDGNVGIGTTSPLQLLHVNGASDGNSIYTAMLQNTGTAASTASKLLFVQGGSTVRGATVVDYKKPQLAHLHLWFLKHLQLMLTPQKECVSQAQATSVSGRQAPV